MEEQGRDLPLHTLTSVLDGGGGGGGCGGGDGGGGGGVH
jgi:hypothetical protein